MREREEFMKTFMAKPAEIKRDWYVIDATGISLGRVATKAANVLRGKHKAMCAWEVCARDDGKFSTKKAMTFTGYRSKSSIGISFL